MSRRVSRFERLTTFVRDLDNTVPQPDPDSGYILVPADARSLDEFRRAEPRALTDRKHGVLRDRLGTDESGWLVRSAAGDWLGWCHLVLGRGPNTRIGHELRLRPDDAFLYDDATLPRYRRRGVHAFTIARRLELAREAGAVRAITTITNTNAASIASYRTLGFRPRSQLVHVPSLGRTVELPLTPAWLREVARAGRRRPRR
jgi:GNAT superfamily N-acetyltransferase